MDEDVRNRSYFPIIISIAAFLLLTFTAGYSFFAATLSTNSVANIMAKMPTTTTVSTTSNDCILDFTSSFMTLENINSNVSRNCYLNVTINGGKDAYCKYDVVFTPITQDVYSPSPGVGTAPYLLELTGKLTGAASVPETQINELSGTTLVSNKIITVTTEGVPVTQSYIFTEKWYNLNLSQEVHAGKTYSYQLGIANFTC